MYEQQDNSTYRIPEAYLAKQAEPVVATSIAATPFAAQQQVFVEPQRISPNSPIAMMTPAPSRKEDDMSVYLELSAASEEVLKCRNTILERIY